MRMNRFLSFIIALLAFPSLCFAQSGKEAFVGGWKLVSIDKVLVTGEVFSADEWLGKNPSGLIIYDASGYMSVQIMRDPQENNVFRYYAYFGPYEVNEKEGFVLHHIKGSLWPEEVGVTYKRNFKMVGNRIMLTTPSLRRLTFERIEKTN
jgi:hypothetical protein